MDAALDAIQDVVAAEITVEAPPVSAQPDDGAVETRLTQEISELWSSHVRLSGDRKATAKELRQVRARLAERLHAMKSLLARPGRGGEWRGWLRQHGIPRSSADRLVARYAETLGGDDGNVLSEAISEPATPTAENLATAVWSSSLREVLVNGETVFQFLASIAQISGIPHERRQEGLMIFNPVTRAADEATASAPAADPAPQPSIEASPTTGGRTVEATATPTEAGQPAEAAAEASGGDAASAPGGPGAAVAAAGDGGV
jgi:hypothetical protein